MFETDKQRDAFDAIVKQQLGEHFYVRTVMGATPSQKEYELNERKADGTIGCHGSYPQTRFLETVTRVHAIMQQRCNK